MIEHWLFLVEASSELHDALLFVEQRHVLLTQIYNLSLSKPPRLVVYGEALSIWLSSNKKIIFACWQVYRCYVHILQILQILAKQFKVYHLRIFVSQISLDKPEYIVLSQTLQFILYFCNFVFYESLYFLIFRVIICF